MVFTTEFFSLNKSGEIDPRPGAGFAQLIGGKRLVLSRALCSYDWIESDASLTTDIIVKRAHLSALEKSPFENTGVFLKTSDHGVSVWSWDADFVNQSARVSSILCIPETAQLSDIADGFYIMDCIDGYEGLFVNDGNILLSRWWTEHPSESDWMRFAYSAETFGVRFEALPEPVRLDRTKTAHRKPQNDLPVRELFKLSDQVRLMSVGIALCLLVTLYPVGRWLHLSAESHLLETEINSISSTFESQLEVIRERSELEAEITRISNVTSSTSQLLPFADAVELITAKSGIIDRISYSDDVWEISFSTTGDFSETDLVRTMEASEYLMAVRVEADRRDNRWIATFENSPNS